jgi:hypothetical protein
MKSVRIYYSSILKFLIGMFIFPVIICGQIKVSDNDKNTIKNFEAQLETYNKLSQNVRSQLPNKVDNKSTAEEIGAYRTSFQKSMQAARIHAKQGDFYTPMASDLIRRIIKDEFKGKERTELRQKVFEAEVAGVPIKINATYPDSKEQIDMPPTLLLRLPQLPKQLRYRFVGKYMFLMDKETGLIIDYMPNALP